MYMCIYMHIPATRYIEVYKHTCVHTRILSSYVKENTTVIKLVERSWSCKTITKTRIIRPIN